MAGDSRVSYKVRAMLYGITGHRPDKLDGWECFDGPVTTAWKNWLRERLTKDDIINVGMACGADLAAAEVAIELGVAVVAWMPFPDQANRWTAPYREQHSQVLRKCRRHAYATPTLGKDLDYDTVRYLLTERNKSIINGAHKVLACWDGSKGGTYNAVMYAHSQKIKVDRFNPKDTRLVQRYQ